MLPPNEFIADVSKKMTTDSKRKFFVQIDQYFVKYDLYRECLTPVSEKKFLISIFFPGEIRVGSKFQADNISPKCLTPSERESDTRRLQDLESLVWTPHHSLTDRQIDQFLVVSRSVGTFARALDCTSSVKQPSLHMSAAAASRDITLVIISQS